MYDPDPGDAAARLPLRAYSSVWQLRGDAWSSLADATKRLVDASVPANRRDTLQKEITDTLLLLDPLETYWAYPGRGQLQRLREMCEEGDFESAAQIADTVAAGLSGAVRAAGPALQPAEEDRPARPEPTGRPAFEVLVVDDIPTTEGEALREAMRRLRRPEDP